MERKPVAIGLEGAVFVPCHLLCYSTVLQSRAATARRWWSREIPVCGDGWFLDYSWKIGHRMRTGLFKCSHSGIYRKPVHKQCTFFPYSVREVCSWALLCCQKKCCERHQQSLSTWKSFWDFDINISISINHLDHQNRSGFQCVALDVIDMQPYVEHNYTKLLYPEPFVFNLDPPSPCTHAISLEVGRVFFSKDTTRWRVASTDC